MTGIAHTQAHGTRRGASVRVATRLLAVAVAVLFVLHGVAHSVGFEVPSA